MTDTLTVRAPAKINLTLDVLAKRPDGYHTLRSVMQTIALHDTVTVTRAHHTPGIMLVVSGPQAEGVPADERNIVHKAAVRLQKTAAARGVLSPQQSGLHLHLTKNVPSQAGLGGGSSDGAATLLAVNVLLGLHLTPARLAEMGAALGADVPFFLTGGTALTEGIGEQVTPLAPLQTSWPLVIVKPAVGMSTPEAYAALDAAPRRSGTATEQWLAGRPSSETQTANDFEAVVLASLPVVQRAYALMLQTMQTHQCFTPRLCGSGSALFLPCQDADSALAVAEHLRRSAIGTVWVTHTTL